MNEQQTYIDRLSAAVVLAVIGAAIMAAVGVAILEDIDHEQEAAIAACRVPVRRTR